MNFRVVKDSTGVYVVCDRGRVCEMSAGHQQTREQDAALIVAALREYLEEREELPT
jgi:hypothetical protein